MHWLEPMGALWCLGSGAVGDTLLLPRLTDEGQITSREEKMRQPHAALMTKERALGDVPGD